MFTSKLYEIWSIEIERPHDSPALPPQHHHSIPFEKRNSSHTIFLIWNTNSLRPLNPWHFKDRETVSGGAGDICGLESCEMVSGVYGWGCRAFGDGNFKWRQTL